MITKDENFFIIGGIYSIRPESGFSVGNTYDSLTWYSEDQVKPTEKEFNDAATAFKTEYDALEYARKRQAEYPDWGTQLNKIYDDGIEKWKTEMVDPIKAKYPK